MDWQEYREKATAARNAQTSLQGALVVGSAMQYVESLHQTNELQEQTRAQQQILDSQRQATAAQQQAAVAQQQAAEAQKMILASQERLMAEAGRQTAVLRETRDAELEAKSQQIRYQFAMWRQTGDGQAYLAWESDAGEYLTYMRSIQAHVAEAETRDHQRLGLLTDNLRTELKTTYFAYKSKEARQSYERNLAWHEKTLAESKSGKAKSMQETADMVSGSAAIFGMIAGLAGLVWVVFQVINFLVGIFTDPPIAAWLTWTVVWVGVGGVVLGVAGWIWSNTLERRVPQPSEMPSRSHYGQVKQVSVSDSPELRTEYDSIIGALKMLGIRAPEDLAAHIRRGQRFALPYSMDALCGFDVSAKITEVERFIESAPRELPTTFPDLPMPRFTNVSVNEQLAIAPVVHGQQVLMETAEQA